MKRAVLLSMWRNDAERGLAKRVTHLLDKSYGNLRYQWCVGDCDAMDTTEAMLRAIAKHHPADITVIRYDTHIVGDDSNTRLRRLSEAFDVQLDNVRWDDELVVLHESDLRTPVDIVERFIASGKCPVAGWPTMTINGHELMYDSFAYVHPDGRPYTNWEPRPEGVTQVKSFGSSWMCDAADIRAGARSHGAGVLGVCADLRAMGRTLWIDPTIEVVQPPEYWTAYQHAETAYR